LAVARQFKVSRANIIGIRDGVVAASQWPLGGEPILISWHW
jgi:hypothetical protein